MGHEWRLCDNTLTRMSHPLADICKHTHINTYTCTQTSQACISQDCMDLIASTTCLISSPECPCRSPRTPRGGGGGGGEMSLYPCTPYVPPPPPPPHLMPPPLPNQPLLCVSSSSTTNSCDHALDNLHTLTNTNHSCLCFSITCSYLMPALNAHVS